MADIFGFLQFSPLLDARASCLKLQKSAQQGFRHPANYYLHEGGMVCLGFALPFVERRWPLISKDGNYILQVFGEIILPDGSLLNPENFDHSFLTPFIQSEKLFLKQLDGAFIFALYSKKENQFTLVNDPFGNLALHYSYQKNGFVFSAQMNGIRAVLGNCEWDEQGLNEYIGLGLTLNGRTLYKTIKRLKPASILRVGLSGLTEVEYLKPEYGYEPSSNNAFDLIKEAITVSIANRLRNHQRIGAALSGGYDSRITWSIIHHLKSTDSVWAFTHGLDNSRDIQIARRITKQFNINHLVNIFSEDFIRDLPTLWEKFTFLNEGANPITAAHAISSWELGSQHYQILMDSHGGAHYRRQFMKVGERRLRSKRSFPDQIFDVLKSSLLNFTFLKKGMAAQAVTGSLAGLNEYFETLSYLKNTADLIDDYYRFQASGLKYALAGNAEANYVQLAHPLLNIKAYEAIQKIPAADRRSQSIYKYIVNKTCPLMKHFPLENMGLPAPYYGFTYLRYFPMVYERVLERIGARLNSTLAKKLSIRKNILNHDLIFQLHFAVLKEILLRRNVFFDTLFSHDELESWLNRIQRHGAINHTRINQLVTFKLYLDIFHG